MVEVPTCRETGPGLQMHRTLHEGSSPGETPWRGPFAFHTRHGRTDRLLKFGGPVLLLPVNFRSLFLSLAALLCAAVQAQEVTIHGRAYSASRDKFYDLMVVNKRTRTGIFGNADGSFTIRALKTDTLLLGSSGHRTQIVTMVDSVPKDS